MMMEVYDDAVLLIDTETTGTNVEEDSIVQIAALLVAKTSTGYVKERILNTFCDPEVVVSEDAYSVHGITPDMYKWAVTARRACEQLYNEIVRIRNICPNLVIGGHNFEYFDLPLIERIANQEFLQPCPKIDSYYLALRIAPHDNHKLSMFYKYITNNEPVDAHDAMADIWMIADVLINYCSNRNVKFMQLADELSIPLFLEIMPWGKKEKGKKSYDVTESFWKWLRENSDRSLPRDLRYTMEKCLIRFENLR
jgi:DNA helicase-2/ATP-dependent DNA helicase PcrA